VSRRTLLRGALALPLLPSPAATRAFVDDYRSNVLTNTTAETNAAVRILAGVLRLWHTGPTWDTGAPLAPHVLRANVRYCEAVTAARTEAQATRAFVHDRQHQSYAVIAGLGILAGVYRAGALAVTGITTAPATTPPTTISDFVPPDAPPGARSAPGRPRPPSVWWPPWSTRSAASSRRATHQVRGAVSSGWPATGRFRAPGDPAPVWWRRAEGGRDGGDAASWHGGRGPRRWHSRAEGWMMS
jgi:hypothetical protein